MPGSQPLTFCLVSQIPRPAPRHRSSEAGSHEAVSHFNLLHVCSDLCLDQRNSRRRWRTALVHRIHAVRDTACDETLWQMRSQIEQQRQSHATPSDWKYAQECPISDLDRRQARLRCYRTTSDDYDKTLHEPTNEIPY